MGRTTRKGEIGEGMVLADLQRKGYGVAIPFGHDLPFDLILIRKDQGGALERVQCKYTDSDGRHLDEPCASNSSWVRHTYTAEEVDWIAVYDITTDRCYYVHSSTWSGMTRPKLRLVAAANGQRKGIRPAEAFLYPELDGQAPREPAERIGTLNAPSPG